MKKLILFIILSTISQFTLSQGDECSTALQLTNLSNYCSSGGSYTNATATVGAFGVPTCWYPTGSSAPNTDVWFKFVAIGTDVLFTVNGLNNSNGATLKNPNIALYDGNCSGTINELRCETNYKDYTYSNNVSIYKGGLKLGNTYLLRISTRQTDIGKFDICINNFTPVPNLNDPNDCDRATIVCNKDATSVGKLNAAGNNTTEVDNLGCFAAASAGESNSTWLNFTCKTSGTLTFEVNGAVPSDDIDWIFMRINGIRNCATKSVLSCNLANCNITKSSSNTEPRKTGIRDGESGLTGTDAGADYENGGCSGAQNGFNQTVQIEAGKTYALFLNNFEGSSGYTVTWGGTSTFVGPESKITVDKTTICVGDDISVNGSSSIEYTTFKWDLPSEASPTTQTTIGPFNQTFNKTGTFPIVLTTYDNNGCLDVTNQLITVNGINADFTAPSVCVGNPTVFTCTTAGLSGLTWDFGDGTTGTGTPTNHTYTNPGDYTAKLTVNGGGCTNVFTQKVYVLGAAITISPDPAQTCPGNQLTLNATANVTGNVSGSKVFSSTGTVSIPDDGFSYGTAPTSWDGTIGTGINSASKAAISPIVVSGLNSSNWKINSITLNVPTNKLKYTILYLETPCGQRIKLINQPTGLSGTGGLNGTMFTPTATATLTGTTPIGAGPYKATDITQWNSNLLSCTNPNGTWKLIGAIWEYSTIGTSSITGWSIDFQSDTPNLIQTIAWSPTTNLSNIAYTGTNTSSGTATAKTSTAETLTLTVTDKGGCTSKKQVTVSISTPNPPSSSGTTVCVNQSATLTATGNPGATFKWYADNTTTTTIPGSGTNGSFTTPNLTTNTSYYVSQISGGCESSRTKVDVNITNSNSISLTSAVGTDDQTVCLNSVITNITYSTNGATGATFTGLPTGVTGTWSANKITISGTPSVNTNSPYNYTITLTGGCGTVTKTGKIIINNLNTITLSSASGTDNQTLCVNKQLTNITYSTTGATGANITGLPAGVTGTWSANVVTITGSPTTNTGSPFTYTITLTGGCGTITKTGTIIVNPKQTLGITCGTTTSSSVQFTWTNIPNSTYNYSYLVNNTGTALTGSLPIGSTNFTKSSLSPGDKVTITITPVGGTCIDPETFTCTAVNCGTPKVDAVNSITECSNTAVTAINFTSPQGTVTFDWTNNNTSIGLAASGTGNIPTFTSSTVSTQQTATISVTATQSGCTGPVTNFTITINPLNTTSLTSTLGTDAQTVCNNSPISDIYYATTGATGATFSGLPTGVSGNWNNNIITISGTPTTANNTPYTYTITLTGGCGTITKTGTIKVNPNNTITLSSAVGSDNQTICVNSNLTNITYTTTGATGANFTGLPSGIVGNFTNNSIIITGNPTSEVGSPFSYNIDLTGGCGTVNKTGTISVNPINTITLTSAANTDNQSICINSPITTITYSTTGATGATFSGLPNGVSGTWSNNTITLSGSPTSNSGSPYNYTITLTGGCGTVTKTGTISIITVNTITLTSSLGSDNQSICDGNSINTIMYTTTGATGADFTGLPSGVSGNWINNSIAIVGTPTSASGSPFNYTITLLGGCGTVTKTGKIIISPINTINLTSNSGTDNQTICVNTPLTNITYATTGATGATFSGLPNGISGVWNNNVITISGNPTQNNTATYNYLINLIGGCGNISTTGIININALNTITLTSGVNSDKQKICKNTSISDITYETTGATGATISGLPSGISGQWLNDEILINGSISSTTGNPFNYTIVLTGGCGLIFKTGSIDLITDNSIILTSASGTDNQNVCLGSNLNTINYKTTGATGANFSGLPVGVNANWTNSLISITGTPTGIAKVYNYGINLIGGCPINDISGSIQTLALPIATPTANTPCEQDILNLDAGLNGAKTYNWIGPNGYTSNLEKPIINNVTLNAKGNYTLIVTDINNCSNSFTLGVIVNPVDNIQFIDVNPTCKNGNVFNLPSVNIPGGTWSSDDNVSIQNPIVGTFDPSKSQPDQYYKVVVTYSTKSIVPKRLCPSTLSKVVFVYPTPDTSFMVKDKLLCITDTLIAEVLNPQPNTTYTWDFNNGQTFSGQKTNYLYPKSGIFDLTITAKLGICTNTSTRKQHIKVVDLPSNAEFTQSETEIDFYNSEVQFQTKTNANYYMWNFGDGSTSNYKNPKHKFPEIPGKYIIDLTVSNMLGKCGVTVSSSIFMPEPVIYFIPNTFTPNGDEINNTFQPVFTYGYDPQNYSFYIYNRWGNLIFESHDAKIGWDGTFGEELVQNDTYIWKLEFKEKIEEYKHIKTGHVTILK